VSFLVPRAAAIVRLGGGRAEINAADWSASFEGVIAEDVAAIARGIVSPRLAALAGSNAAAAALVSWREHPWLPLTVLDAVRLDGFDTLFLELLGTCNERCVHCYAESSPQVRAALDRATCEAIIEDAHAAGFKRIQFTGGDPLICAFLPELVELARSFDVREIYTNGMLLDDKLLDRLAPHDPCFAFSYYSQDPAIHDTITRTPGSHRRTRAAIERTIARGLGARVSIVVLDENVATVDATVADLEAIGVTRIAAAAGRAAGRGNAFTWQPAAPPPGATAGHRAADSQSDGKLAITYEGDVVPCIFNRSRVLGSIAGGRRLRDVLADLAATPGDAAGSEKLSCGSCRTTDLALATVAHLGAR
jgi:MoaA/NifB/PqqE/SkfB family radical SAM enzyme